MELTFTIHNEAGGYWAQAREWPGCFAAGRTLDELAEALQEAVGQCLDDPCVVLVYDELHVGDAAVTAIKA